LEGRFLLEPIAVGKKAAIVSPEKMYMEGREKKGKFCTALLDMDELIPKAESLPHLLLALKPSASLSPVLGPIFGAASAQGCRSASSPNLHI